jgi:hypothetical protein
MTLELLIAAAVGAILGWLLGRARVRVRIDDIEVEADTESGVDRLLHAVKLFREGG